MTRHVDVVGGKYYDGLDEQVAGYVAKAIYDLISTKTVQSLSISRVHKELVATIVWDD